MANNSQAEKSKPVLGTGIFLTGLVVLIIGVIIGVKFPKYVLSHVKEHACVTRPESRDYQEWVQGGGTRLNRVYIMDLTNSKEFIHKGEEPKFQRRGPYVYQEEETKINITFSGSLVTFRLWTVQTFRPDLTSRECGPDCSPSNKVTVINPVFLQLVQPFGNKINFHSALIPRLMRNIRETGAKNPPDDATRANKKQQASSTTIFPTSSSSNPSSPFISDILTTTAAEISPTSSKPGATSKSNTESAEASKRGGADSGATASRGSVDILQDFDSWIAVNDTTFKQRILGDPNVTRNEVPSVLLRLYETLGSATKFGVQFLKNETLVTWCETHLAEFMTAINQNSSEALLPHLVSTAAIQCGVLFYLQLLGRQSAPPASIVLPFISALFCPTKVTNDYCWYPLTLSDNRLRDAYVESVWRYVIKYVPSVIWDLVQLDMEHVTSLPVGHVVLGYVTSLGESLKVGSGIDDDDDVTSQAHPLMVQKFFVRGILAHQQNLSDVDESSSFRITLRTCLWDRSSKNNFFLHALDAPFSSWLDTDRSSRSFRPSPGGLTFKAASSPALTACRAAPPANDFFPFYVPDIGRGHEFARVAYDSVEGVNVVDYKPEPQVRNGRKCNNFVFETTSLLNYKSWTIFPLHHNFGSPDIAENMVSIEPVSGEIWRSSSVVHVQAGVRPFPSSSSSKPSEWRRVPYYWLHREQQPSKQQIAGYQTEVAVLMRSSCGGLVSLVLAGLVVMMLGAAFVVIRRPDNRVMPDGTEASEGFHNTF